MEVWKGKRWGIAAILHTKIDQHEDFTRCESFQRQENPDRAKNQSDCRICYRALLKNNKEFLCIVI